MILNQPLMKILILQNKLLHYRIPVFNLLNAGTRFEVTLAHPGITAKDKGIDFQQLILQVARLGPFILHNNLYKLCCQYEVVIAMFDLKWLTHMKLAFKKQRPFRLIFWGIGVSTNKGFDVGHRFDGLRFFIARRADGLLLYSEMAKRKYLQANFPENRVFVANNSVENSTNRTSTNTARDCFIFLGSLDKRKKLEELIKAFRIMPSIDSTSLIIVGEGAEKENIQNLIKYHHLQERVQLKGHISDVNKLETLFNKALACISPGQAGLSVLRSFSFGVPFICRSDAITGGERFNIKNDNNGYQYSGGAESLAKIMIKLVQNPNLSRELGNNAQKFFLSSRTLEHMINGFVKAIIPN